MRKVTISSSLLIAVLTDARDRLDEMIEALEDGPDVALVDADAEGLASVIAALSAERTDGEVIQ